MTAPKIGHGGVSVATNHTGAPAQATMGGELKGGTFRDGTGSYRYVDGKKVRVADQVPYAGKAEKPKKSPRLNARAVERDDGRVYPSQTKAAEDVGGHSSDLGRAIRNGYPYHGHKYRFVGSDWVSQKRGPHGEVKVIRDDGREWPSIRACAAELGTTSSVLFGRIERKRPYEGHIYRREQ